MNIPLKSAQRRYDNELPPLDEPFIPNALPCKCGCEPLLAMSAWRGMVYVKCWRLSCAKEGPPAWNEEQAVDGWNERVMRWRKRE